ncbi:SulP family inorganic anion transporter [Salimicrobium flavidum]|uniref:Sulfate permease, SulP family n=1 Tax=Salimicrobium flavidum TaxID=570947 RepID=A0A1N7JJJ4_9BACI|nr:solute carrier family 26 protein [Salimicrobium flavidum]SIS49431.1 sulfate permease, SulP family [Salimicrobium flavidum]
MFNKNMFQNHWLMNYQKGDLKNDFSAGLIVAIMLIPQGMAYSMLAGLPPVIGLYASTLPLIVYALLGSSRQLAVGPVAMVSLLVLSGVSTLAEPGSGEYVSLVLLLSLMVGVIQLSMGLLRLGFVVNFLSHAVISGFTSAAALIIGLSQLKNLIGVDLAGQKNIFIIITDAVTRISEINWTTFLIGIGSILLLVFFKRKAPRFPAPLVVVVASTLLVYFFNLEERGVSIIKEVPDGLPALSIPAFNVDSFMALLPIALTISFVGFMESIAVAKAIASKEKYKVESNRELTGLGAANIVGSFFSASPVTGGFSRTAVNYQAGAKSGLASIITALLIMITLLFFTDWFYYLPNAVLAAIIMVAVFGLIDVKEAKHLFRIKKADGWILVLTFAATLVTGIESGILIGAGAALLLFIWNSAYPHTAVLGYLQEEGVYRNIERYPDALEHTDTLIFRMDASLYFANFAFLEEKIRNILAERPEVGKVVLDFSGVNRMDGVAVDELEKLIDEYDEAGVYIHLAQVKGPVRDLLKNAGWEEKYGTRIKHLHVQEAASY